MCPIEVSIIQLTIDGNGSVHIKEALGTADNAHLNEGQEFEGRTITVVKFAQQHSERFRRPVHLGNHTLVVERKELVGESQEIGPANSERRTVPAHGKVLRLKLTAGLGEGETVSMGSVRILSLQENRLAPMDDGFWLRLREVLIHAVARFYKDVNDNASTICLSLTSRKPQKTGGNHIESRSRHPEDSPKMFRR